MRWIIIFVVVVIGGAIYLAHQTPTPPPRMTPIPEVDSEAAAQRVSQIDHRDKMRRIQAIGERHGITLSNYAATSRGAEFTAQWSGMSVGPGGDFLTSLMREGVIRNFDYPGADGQGVTHDKSGRRIYWQRCKVTY